MIDLVSLSQVWWLHYDYLTQNKTWDIDLNRYIRAVTDGLPLF